MCAIVSEEEGTDKDNREAMVLRVCDTLPSFLSPFHLFSDNKQVKQA
jgi:hypothetical protein